MQRISVNQGKDTSMDQRGYMVDEQPSCAVAKKGSLQLGGILAFPSTVMDDS